MAEPAELAPKPTPAGDRGARPRPVLRRVQVVQTDRVTPRLVSVILAGDELAGFQPPAPTSHIKVFLPPPGQVRPQLPEVGANGMLWPDGARPAVRTYTPRKFDPAAMTLEVQFLLHGDGPASEWASRVTAGDQLAIAGPGGRFTLKPDVKHWWIGGDESAVPAIGTILDALAASATAEVHIEVAGQDDEIDFATGANVSVQWHHRRTSDGYGAELYEAAVALQPADATQAWVACEAAAVRRIRGLLINDHHLGAEAVTTRGYWRSGQSDHPDHDYGQD